MRKHRPDCQHLVIVPGEKTESFGDNLVRTHTIASPLLSRTSRYRALTKLHLIEEVLEKERPDIIESGDPYQVAWKAVASGRGLDIPVVGFYHSHFPEAYFRTIAKFFGPLAVSVTDEICRKYVTSLYNRFECTFVPSPVLAKLLCSWGVERIHTVDLGVDADAVRVEGRLVQHPGCLSSSLQLVLEDVQGSDAAAHVIVGADPDFVGFHHCVVNLSIAGQPGFMSWIVGGLAAIHDSAS